MDEIERLTASDNVRQEQIKADAQVREAQIAADLKRDLVARGLSVADVERLSSEPRSQSNQVIESLATAVVEMVNSDEGTLDTEAVAGLLAPFLQTGEASVLAAAFAQMIHAGDLDQNVVEKLLTTFMEKGTPRPDLLRQAEPTTRLPPGTPNDGPAGQGQAHLDKVPGRSIPTAEWSRESATKSHNIKPA